MQVCLSTSTMPSARRNDAPVGQTSTHGGSAQCWHMSGRVLIRPVARSRRVTLWIHRGSVAGPCTGSSPCSSSQARTQASQSRAHLATSTSIPKRTSPLTGSSGSRIRRARARGTRARPGTRAAPATIPARARKRRRAALPSVPCRPFTPPPPGTPSSVVRRGIRSSRSCTETYSWQLAQNWPGASIRTHCPASSFAAWQSMHPTRL